VLEKEANERRSPLKFITEPLLGYTPAIAGEHQRWNAALAVEALHLAGLQLNSDILRQGLGKVSWPGRFERVRPNIILDGAHNPHAAKSLAETWRGQFGDSKATLIFSAVSNKNIRGVLELLYPIAKRILLCPVDSPRATPIEDLIAALPEKAPAHSTHASIKDAITAAEEHKETILIAGSLFLIGEARGLLTGVDYQRCEQ
jgi:dihydrofolate synthase/folylpolyglutamate synthase